MKHAICCGFAVALVIGCGPSGSGPNAGPTPRDPAGSRRIEVPAPDDQVSVGYGTQSKRDATAAITSVSPTEADARVTRIEYLLQARAPGPAGHPLPNGTFTL